jgi:hypothetical protein
MTKREALRQTHQENTLLNLGFTREEAEALRRISLTLHRWFEHECNGAIQRDGENGDGRPYWYNTHTGRKIAPVADREAGAMRRLRAIINARNDRATSAALANETWKVNGVEVSSYIQGDPRGAALYIIRPGDVPERQDVNSYYTRGIVVY